MVESIAARADAARQAARILVVSTVHWASTTRLCLALADGGFDVLVLAPDGHAVHDCPRVSSRRLARTHGAALRSLYDTIREWQPAAVVPGDEGAVGLARAIHARESRARGDNDIVHLIERSIGDQNAFRIAGAKTRFVELARSLDLLVPETRPLHGEGQLEAMAADFGCPFVLKVDGSFGGLGVRIVRARDAAAACLAALRADAGWLSAVKLSLRRLDIYPLRRMLHGPRTIAVQAYVAGRPANRAVLCRDGRVLAGLSVEAIETVHATGPASVVRFIHHPMMSDAAVRLVERLNLSGFVGFDFVLEAGTGRAVLLEMNLRPTQICHLALDAESDMIGALARAVGAVPTPRPLPNFPRGTVALFPQERWRDPRSPHLATAFHDVPWHAPEIVRAYSQPVAPEPPDWTDKLRARRPAAGIIEPETVDV